MCGVGIMGFLVYSRTPLDDVISEANHNTLNLRTRTRKSRHYTVDPEP